MEQDTTRHPLAESIADDILRGARAIASFLGEDKRRVFYLAERGIVPIGREGKNLVASKRRLRQHYDGLTAGGTVADNGGAA
jgi:hypothetical protein